jgi:hypothetical protein
MAHSSNLRNPSSPHRGIRRVPQRTACGAAGRLVRDSSPAAADGGDTPNISRGWSTRTLPRGENASW